MYLGLIEKQMMRLLAKMIMSAKRFELRMDLGLIEKSMEVQMMVIVKMSMGQMMHLKDA
jgi:hypothetical protein